MEEDVWDTRLKDDERRVRCSCFVEGDVWTYMKTEIPENCPEWRHCRYHILHT